jgi:fructokinase
MFRSGCCSRTKKGANTIEAAEIVMEIAIGIDLGGTKTELIALDDADHELLRRRVPTPRDNYNDALGVICCLIWDTEAKLGARATVGVGHPGVVSRTSGLVKNANSTWLIGHPLVRDLEARLARPVTCVNDANCFALSEATDGAAAGFSVAFAVILGTGVGGGICVNGRILTGPNAIAGEWGHAPLPWASSEELPGPHCYCGKYGCLEIFLSGPALTCDHERTTGRNLTPPDILAAAASGDLAAEASLARYEDRLARGLAIVVNLLDPDVIVLGGGISNLDRLYENLPRLLPRYVFSDRFVTSIRRAAHGDSSGVRGAARLGRQYNASVVWP